MPVQFTGTKRRVDAPQTGAHDWRPIATFPVAAANAGNDFEKEAKQIEKQLKHFERKSSP